MFEYEHNKDFIILEQSLSLTFLNPNQLASTKKDHNDGNICNDTNPQRSGEEETTLDTNHSLHTMFSQLQNLDTLYHVYKIYEQDSGRATYELSQFPTGFHTTYMVNI